MLRSLDIAEISLVEKQSRYLVAVDMAENLSFEQEIERVIAETKNTNFAVCMTLPMVPCFQWSIYIKENSASIVPYILKCLFLFPKRGLHLQPAGTYLRAFVREIGKSFPKDTKKSLPMQKSKGQLCVAMLMKQGSMSWLLIV